MIVDCFVMCAGAETAANGQLSITRILNAISTKSLPINRFPGMIAMHLRFAKDETGKHEFELRVVDPDGKIIDRQPASDDVQIPPGQTYACYAHALMPMSTQIEEYGPHAVELWLDGDLKASYEFSILRDDKAG